MRKSLPYFGASRSNGKINYLTHPLPKQKKKCPFCKERSLWKIKVWRNVIEKKRNEPQLSTPKADLNSNNVMLRILEDYKVLRAPSCRQVHFLIRTIKRQQSIKCVWNRPIALLPSFIRVTPHLFAGQRVHLINSLSVFP